MARAFPSADSRVRRAIVAVVVAVVLVGLITSTQTGFPDATTPRLAMIKADPSTSPGPGPMTDPASSDATPTPIATGTSSRSGRGGGGVDNGSPPGVWQYAEDSGPVFGTAGAVYSFRVAVESGVPVSVPQFTAAVDGALGDYRSWIAAGTLRLVRVPGGLASSFTVLLAQPWTAYGLCLSIGIDIRVNGVPYTSCQAGARIVINVDRYVNGASGYGASLTVYRQYAINHEVGHWLGHGHALCPGAGQLAPVMQQQTLGLQDCLANAWPYPYADAPPAPEPTPTPTPTPTQTTPPATTPPATPTDTSSTTTTPPVTAAQSS